VQFGSNGSNRNICQNVSRIGLNLKGTLEDLSGNGGLIRGDGKIEAAAGRGKEIETRAKDGGWIGQPIVRAGEPQISPVICE
jgi:hypothetical protein